MNLSSIRGVVMGILSGNPQNEPLHYGEVFGVWSYLITIKGKHTAYQVYSNHAGDEDLKKLIKSMLDDMKREVEQLEEVLKANGIGLPPTQPERPVAALESIPVGARIMDPEISAAITMDLAQGLVACSTIMGQSIREDIAATFGQFHMAKAQYGLKVLRLNKEKGWLIPPPLHVKIPELV
jgi:hypothetical protein